MHPNKEFRKIDELRVGDVILCHCDPSQDLVAKKIHQVTASEYCHAAIVYGDSFAAESRAKNGIKKGKIEKTSVEDLISKYGHVAVLRQPDAWATEDRVKALRLFINTVVNTQAKYNFEGVLNFKSRKEFHESHVFEKLEHFFSNNVHPQSPLKSQYFCSEFVCDCFIAVGFIQPSAAVLFQSDTISPGDLGKEPAFGTFWGYLTTKADYKVSELDRFYYATTFDALFGI